MDDAMVLVFVSTVVIFLSYPVACGMLTSCSSTQSPCSWTVLSLISWWCLHFTQTFFSVSCCSAEPQHRVHLWCPHTAILLQNQDLVITHPDDVELVWLNQGPLFCVVLYLLFFPSSGSSSGVCPVVTGLLDLSPAVWWPLTISLVDVAYFLCSFCVCHMWFHAPLQFSQSSRS